MELHKKITDLLMSTERDGMDMLVKWLYESDFFTAPASTRFHGCHRGGLAEHSLRVYELLNEHCLKLEPGKTTGPGQKPLPLGPNNIIIAALLHDVCKIGAYIPTPKGKNPYKWNRDQPKGHASLSIDRVQGYIELTEIEIMMIRYHMGVYGLVEFYGEKDWQSGEFDLGGITSIVLDLFGDSEVPLRGDHSGDKKIMTKLDKEEQKAKRYGMSLANAWHHNPICKLMYFCDEIATLEEKL